MSDRDLVSRAGNAAALNIAQHDQNLNALSSTSEEQAGATYEVVYTDHGKLIELNNASMVCTLDAIADIVAAMDTGVDNFKVTLKNTNADIATVNRSSTDTIDGAASILLTNNETVTLQTNAADDEWLKKSAKPAIYSGKVDGTNPEGSSHLPSGWTAIAAYDYPYGIGSYMVTHNLGTANYTVVGMAEPLSDVPYNVSTEVITTTTFTLWTTRLDTVAPANCSINFMLTVL